MPTQGPSRKSQSYVLCRARDSRPTPVGSARSTARLPPATVPGQLEACSLLLPGTGLHGVVHSTQRPPCFPALQSQLPTPGPAGVRPGARPTEILTCVSLKALNGLFSLKGFGTSKHPSASHQAAEGLSLAPPALLVGKVSHKRHSHWGLAQELRNGAGRA